MRGFYRKVYSICIKVSYVGIVLICLLNNVSAQQYNSDSWLSKPHGMVTLIPTVGQRNSMIMNTFSLFPRWEFTVAAYIYNDDGDLKTDDGYSTSLYGKYMFYENKAQTGGAAVKAGTGMFPGTIDKEDRTDDAFKTYWVNFPITFPLFNNKLSWDVMPGSSATKRYGQAERIDWSFTYSTRMAWYVLNDKWSIVGEVFGTQGEMSSIPEYKIGWRWEPSQHLVFAITYGQEFNGNNGAGLEVGLMIFTPQFACVGPCKKY